MSEHLWIIVSLVETLSESLRSHFYSAVIICHYCVDITWIPAEEYKRALWFQGFLQGFPLYQMFFASHCGYTNATYYESKFPRAFSGPFHHMPVTVNYFWVNIDLRPNEPSQGEGEEEEKVYSDFNRWQPCGHIAIIDHGDPGHTGLATGPRDVVFFSKHLRYHNWFIVVFPFSEYGSWPSNDDDGVPPVYDSNLGWELPTAFYYIFIGCPHCGHYEQQRPIFFQTSCAGDGCYWMWYPKTDACSQCGCPTSWTWTSECLQLGKCFMRFPLGFLTEPC